MCLENEYAHVDLRALMQHTLSQPQDSHRMMPTCICLMSVAVGRTVNH